MKKKLKLDFWFTFIKFIYSFINLFFLVMILMLIYFFNIILVFIW
jgi:hypothetical protein